LLIQAVKNVLEHWPQKDLEPAVLDVCNFMKCISSNPITCESLDCDESGKKKTSSKVHIAGADFLNVKFDPRYCLFIIVWQLSFYRQH